MTLAEKINLMQAEIPETKAWLDTFKANSERTALAYGAGLAVVLEELEIHSFDGIKNFSTSDMTRIYDVASKRSWSKHTTNQYVTNLKRFIEWCNGEELADNKTLNKYKKLKSTTEPTYVFSFEDENKILNTITSKRLRCIINLFLEIGSRKCSVLNIKLSDLNGDMLTITDKGDKTTSHKLSAGTLNMINDYIATDRNETMRRYSEAGGTDCGWLFVSNFTNGSTKTNYENGLHISDGTLNEQVKNVARKAGVEHWDKISPHSFRKRFGIDTYYSNGCDIVETQKKMKHSSANQTAYYVGKYDISQEEKNELVKRNPSQSGNTVELLLKQIADLTETIQKQSQVINTLVGVQNI